ncbi:hypothetical protein R3P38DRAFT_3227758 [Favolaschia claudopus]|uniref:Uncharacterized protein n=1 Tax=Favolaschia claudopus TaxID=2862362 RepID=A0AAV9ZRD9_9AGAR
MSATTDYIEATWPPLTLESYKAAQEFYCPDGHSYDHCCRTHRLITKAMPQLISLTAWTEKPWSLENNDYPWGSIVPFIPAEFEPEWSVPESDTWSSGSGNSHVPELAGPGVQSLAGEDWLFGLLSKPIPSSGTPTTGEETPVVCYSNRCESPLAVAIRRGNMESGWSNLQLDLTNNIKLCAPLASGLSYA